MKAKAVVAVGIQGLMSLAILPGRARFSVSHVRVLATRCNGGMMTKNTPCWRGRACYSDAGREAAYGAASVFVEDFGLVVVLREIEHGLDVAFVLGFAAVECGGQMQQVGDKIGDLAAAVFKIVAPGFDVEAQGVFGPPGAVGVGYIAHGRTALLPSLRSRVSRCSLARS